MKKEQVVHKVAQFGGECHSSIHFSPPDNKK